MELERILKLLRLSSLSCIAGMQRIYDVIMSPGSQLIFMADDLSRAFRNLYPRRVKITRRILAVYSIVKKLLNRWKISAHPFVSARNCWPRFIEHAKPWPRRSSKPMHFQWRNNNSLNSVWSVTRRLTRDAISFTGRHDSDTRRTADHNGPTWLFHAGGLRRNKLSG